MTACSLSAGSLLVDLSPEIGGSIARFDWTAGNDAPIPILRGCSGTLSDPLEAACFPLVPFSNRIGDRRFSFGGRTVRLNANMRGEGCPIHGQGWQRPWALVAADTNRATLRFRHDAGEWPWAYEAEQRFVLGEQGLSATLLCRNLSDETMPCGLGFHPYFPCCGNPRLTAAVEGVWTVDDHVLPTGRIAADGHYALDGRLVCGRALDNGYDGWSGRADIAFERAPFALALLSSTARYFQLFSPADGGLFVAEPVSHANNALAAPEAQWASLGIRLLAPGETMALDMRIAVSAR